jgi:membrane protease YdiL (CAAX protease family)
MTSRTARYFVLAFAITWVLQLPALLARFGVIAGPQEKYLALVGLGAFGPAAAAMICARSDGGIRALLRPLARSGVNPLWYVAALLVPGALYLVAAAIYDRFGHDLPLAYPPNRPAFVLALFVFSIGEEIGWRGYALPKLMPRFGALGASVIIGVFWTLWHIPMLTLQGIGASLYPIFFAFMIGGSVLFTWLVQRARGSLLVAVVAHAGAHLSNSGHALPANATPIALHAIAYVVFAVALVAFDRRVFRQVRSPTGHATPVPPSPQ